MTELAGVRVVVQNSLITGVKHETCLTPFYILGVENMDLHIKRTLQPLISGDQIIFGIGNKGLIRKIPYSESSVMIIKYLNGEIPRKDLKVSDQKLSDCIDKFKSLGLITTNSYSDKPKYSRNISFFEWMDTSDNIDPNKYQEKLQRSKVAVFGVGGIGSAVAEYLVRAGVKNIKLIDFDIVEESNLTRQTAYVEDDINKPKIVACSEYLKKIDSTINVETVNCKITGPADIEANIDMETDLIVNSMDQPPELDGWFDEVSKKTKKAVIFSSYASTAANVYPKIPGVTRDYSEFLGKEQITKDCIIDNSFPMAAISSVTAMAAGMSSYYAIMFLTGIRIPKDAIQIDFDGWTILKVNVATRGKEE